MRMMHTQSKDLLVAHTDTNKLHSVNVIWYIDWDHSFRNDIPSSEENGLSRYTKWRSLHCVFSMGINRLACFAFSHGNGFQSAFVFGFRYRSSDFEFFAWWLFSFINSMLKHNTSLQLTNVSHTIWTSNLFYLRCLIVVVYIVILFD